MQPTEYQQKIIDYYHATENAYKDTWDLDASLAIHYGYWDEKVKTFRQSLQRMNEVMTEKAGITQHDKVLDAGCGVGGSSIYIAAATKAKVTGITLIEKQKEQAFANAKIKGVSEFVDFRVMNYCATDFPDASFDVVWACESVCYADNKEQFVQEAMRLLKPGGRFILADGFVPDLKNNEHPIIRQWLDGWEVNYLETPDRFVNFMKQTGFDNINYCDISKQVYHSSRRLYQFYFLANIYLFWKKISFSNRATSVNEKNRKACKYQYQGMKKALWQYGMITGRKPDGS